MRTTLRVRPSSALARIVVSRQRAGLGAIVAAAIALALGLAAAGITHPLPAFAAAPDLTVVTSAQYDVLPDEGRLAISLGVTATNHLQDTVTKQFYFDKAYLAVMPGTSNFKITSGSGTPRAVIESKQATYWLLRIDFPSHLDAGKSMTFQLTMDLKDPGGTPTRPIRITPSLVSFPVWAYGSTDTPGSTVAVTFPADYQVELEAGKLAGPRIEADGRKTWTSGAISDALAFYAYLVADKPGGYSETSQTVELGGTPALLVVRSWPDDPDWSTRVGGLFERGLPVLSQAIGLPWSRTAPLVVQEAVSRTSGGYAGLFDAAAGKVEVAYYAGPVVILHEAAHAWFNGELLADRWANEAFASWYAQAAATTLGEKVTTDTLTPALKANAIPLNAWGALGETPPENENYAYAASLELARLIAERAGADGLQALWAAAASGEAAYQPRSGATERVDAAPDWRGLLDLLERPAGSSYVDLWQQWVMRPADAALLPVRAAARRDYDAVVAEAADWELPRSIRDAMRTWQFSAATDQLDGARSVLEQRKRVQDEATALHLTPPTTLRTLFEQNGALDDALAEAAAERTAIAAIGAALASRPTDPDVAQTIGLLGVTPDEDIETARSAFAAGRLADAEAAAAQARLAWLSAAGFGRTRLTSLGLLVLAALIMLAAWIARRRHRRQAALAFTPGRMARTGAAPKPRLWRARQMATRLRPSRGGSAASAAERAVPPIGPPPRPIEPGPPSGGATTPSIGPTERAAPGADGPVTSA